jgi:hypothetical protein
MHIETRRDSIRGCGWRKPGGLYLVAGGVMAGCGKLPIPLGVCPTCHAGVKPSRGWTWVDGDALVAGRPCAYDATRDCRPSCPMRGDVGQVGLLWVGGQFYKTPGDWLREAARLGVSRRIPAVPRGFVLGETWVFVAHRQCLPTAGVLVASDDAYKPGIFHAFKPSAVEYVVTGRESKKKLAALVERGITPVKVERVEEPRELPLVDDGLDVLRKLHGETRH